MTPREQAVLADRTEEAAFIDMYEAAPATLRAQMGLAVERVGGAAAFVAARLPATMFNRVIGLGLDRPATTGDLDALRRVYRDAGVGTWWLHWSPSALPADGPAWLAAQGFNVPVRGSWAKMLRATSEPPSVATDLVIAPAVASQAAAVGAAVAQAFGMPPFMGEWIAALHGRPAWCVYAVTEGDVVVGGGSLFLGPDAGWLGMGAVLPTHRRRGGQGALMARRIADAGAAGLDWVVTETGEPIAGESNPSLANMARTGFRCVASRLNFECAPPAARAP
jgi:GNAT superfamily N-acetyltransferase